MFWSDSSLSLLPQRGLLLKGGLPLRTRKTQSVNDHSELNESLGSKARVVLFRGLSREFSRKDEQLRAVFDEAASNPSG